MSRLDELRAMRDFIDREIAREEQLSCPELKKAAGLYGVTVDEIVGWGRTPGVVRARQGAAWLLHRRGLSYQQIATMLGYRDRKTAIYGCRKIDGSPPVRALLLGLEVVA